MAEELISLMGLDVVLMAVTHENAKEQVRVSNYISRICIPKYIYVCVHIHIHIYIYTHMYIRIYVFADISD